MTWFRIDDGFWSHPKVVELPDGAVALWVRGGSWSSQHLTDGHIPARALTMLGGRRRDADALVKAGLWIVDVDGWRYHDWATYQPTRDQVQERRAATAERVRRWREKRRDDDPDEPPDNGDT